MSPLTFNLSTFHDYDIRGIYPTEINESFFYHLGKSIALYVKKGPIAVGHDVRTSSPSLMKSLVDGITDYGLDVISHGRISTEMHYYSAGKYQYEANVMITASHNPGEYNGMKMVTKGVVALNGSFGLPEIKDYMTKDLPKAPQKGSVEEQDIFEEFIQYALSRVDVNKFKDLKIVVDAGNGAGGETWKYIMENTSLQIVPLYLEPDGSFPNHLADPLNSENVADLINVVRKEKADIGLALDGDADRVFFIDETGTKLTGTVSTAILTQYMLEHEKGAILFPSIMGKVVAETVKKYGGKPIKTRVGHSIIKEKMKEHSGIFAGEHSGHFYFKENFNAESSLLASLHMLDILVDSGESLSQLREEYDIYPQSGEINFRVPDRDAMITKIKEKFGSKADSIDEMEGYSFYFKDYWFNVRLSKTEPLLRLNVEADTSDVLTKQTDTLVSFIEENGGKRK